jgi:hypothetical protein
LHHPQTGAGVSCTSAADTSPGSGQSRSATARGDLVRERM